MPTLDSLIAELGPIAKRVAPRLAKLGLVTVRDLLLYFPFRYDDFRTVSPIIALKPNIATTIHGTVRHIANRRSFRKHMMLTEALIEDKTASVRAIWFQQPYVGKILKPGLEISLAGEPTQGSAGLEFRNPSYEVAGRDTHPARLVPIYSLTSGLTQKQIRTVVANILSLAATLPDHLPKNIIAREKLLPLGEAVHQIHFPDDDANLEAARARLAFDEVFILQLTNQTRRRFADQQQAQPIPFNKSLAQSLVANLPFPLTQAQRRTAWEIFQDIERSRPMTRLLEGDVGSGKTAVAALAAGMVAETGWQSVFLAPTDMLARQHFDTLARLLPKKPIVLVTRTIIKLRDLDGSIKECTTAAERRAFKKILPSITIVIGTHALLQESIELPKLALLIIDEQHRFGVTQRSLLVAGSRSLVPHVLSMTATPIPRSLALALLSDLDISILDEMPRGRKPIGTHIVPPEKRSAAYEFIHKELTAGRQCYVVCPLIDPSDVLGVKSATETFAELQTIFPKFKLALLHSKLATAQKEKIRQEFLAGTVDMLIATSVVEVGVDVPNATIMLIEGADRFGLAQLWQLRGRVGRSTHQSWCLLFTDTDRPEAKQRLELLTKAKTGFEVAETDLRLRGPGTLTGTDQSGWLDFRFASIADTALIRRCRVASEQLLQNDPTLESAPLLRTQCEQQPGLLPS